MDKIKIAEFWYLVEEKMPELFLQYGLGKEVKEYFVEDDKDWEEEYEELREYNQELEEDKRGLEDEVKGLEQRCEDLEGILEENDIDYE